MPFITKLDYSDNRQIKQHVETRTELSGATSFGVPFSALTTGPSTTISAITNTINGVISTFSGNTGTTVYSFTGANMDLGASYLIPITPANSGTTKFTGNVFTGDTSTTIDNNLIFLTYTGVNYSIFVTQMEEVSPGNYTGTTNSNIVNYLSASTLDFTGRTIWVDVPNGITRTQDLIITRNPVIGNVWTCINGEGKGSWTPSSGGTDITTTGGTFTNTTGIATFINNTGGTFSVTGFTNVWTAGTGNSSAVLSGSGSIASGNFTVAEGQGTTASGNGSHSEGQYTVASGIGAHAEGSGCTASGHYSHAEGHLTTASGVRAHAEGRETIASGEMSHAEGYISIASGDYSHAEGENTQAIGQASHAEGFGTIASGSRSHSEGLGTLASGSRSHSEGRETTASGQDSHAEGFSTRASGDYSHAEGVSTRASGSTSHAEGSGTTASGNFSHAGGSNTIANGDASFVHGTGSTANGVGTIVLGNNITGNISNTTYVEDLIIDGLTSTDPIATNANGMIVAGTSDFRLKQNISELTNSLSIINSLRGVSFEYIPESEMGPGIRYGFIAQEVQEFVPDIVRLRSKGDGMLSLNYNEIVPILVEAVKELSSGVTTSNNTHLETQTILAEDNNIDLNYSGTQQTSVGGGITVLHAMGQDLGAQIITDSDGNWITNNDFKPSGLTIPIFTPTSTNDTAGNEGNITRDDNFLYVKGITGWKRSNLESF